MGVSIVMMEWFQHLQKHKVFDGADMLELGPQDLFASSDQLKTFFAHAHFDAPGRTRKEVEGALISAMSGSEDNAQSRSNNDLVQSFYKLLGVNSYEALDAFDLRADHTADLNFEYDLGKTYSLITDFGTSEHCFNIQNSFRMLDKHLAVGGVALFVLPTFADINHGFWNVHPNVFPAFALANGYEVLDFTYVDDAMTREETYCDTAKGPIDFSAFPIQPSDTLDRAEVQKNYLKNCLKKIAPLLGAPLSTSDADTAAQQMDSLDYEDIAVFDHCYVALRKKKATSSFLFPYQQEYNVIQYLLKLDNLAPDVKELIIAPAGAMARGLVARKDVQDRFERIVLIDNFKAGETILGCDVVAKDSVNDLDIDHALIVHTNADIIAQYTDLFKEFEVDIVS